MDAIWIELYNAAKEVQNPRQISDYVSGGEVAAVMPDGKCGAPCGACRELMTKKFKTFLDSPLKGYVTKITSV
ncbi:MAG: hypothetical protein SPG48_10425 [Treponema sp.]|nr:hypothetical protein [Treponema sp.]